ncbi:MAG: enoyl-CoA hydratase/isomerase family protein, partial [Pseudomonadota bacterium]
MHLHIKGAVAEIRLDNPSKLNALTMTMIRQLDRHAEVIEADGSVRAVLLTAEGGRAFCV